MRSRLGEYADQKIAEHDRPSWVALGLGRDSRLTVVVREIRSDLTLAHSLLHRQPAPDAADTASGGRRDKASEHDSHDYKASGDT